MSSRSKAEIAASTISPRSVRITSVTTWESGSATRQEDYLAAEEPLEIRSGQQSLGVTMRTPGHDLELVAGLLLSEGIISHPEQLVSPQEPDLEPVNGVLQVELSAPNLSSSHNPRVYSAGSACGLCGKASIESVRQRISSRPETRSKFDPRVICALPDRLRERQNVFRRTGGLHAAALFDLNGELLVLREDIGRHNAVDKVLGWALLQHKLPLDAHICLVSGRGGFEIVQKALIAGVPLLASVSAPSSLAVQLARELGMSLIGFLRGDRFVIYSGEERVLSAG